MDSIKHEIHLITENIPHFISDNQNYHENSINYIKNTLYDISEQKVHIVNTDALHLEKNKTYFFGLYLYSFNFLIDSYKNNKFEIQKFFTKLSEYTVKIFISNTHESFELDVIEKNMKVLQECGIKNENIIWFDNSIKTNHDDKFQQLGMRYYKSYNLSTGFSTMLFDKFSWDKFSNKKGKFFLCKNKTPKPHRYLNLALLHKNGILDDVNFSLLYQDSFNYDEIYGAEYSMLKKHLEIIENIKNKTTDYEKLKFTDEHEIDFAREGHIYDYRNSYVNLTTESLFFNDLVHITEKSFKPFYALQFPIFIATPKHVHFLEKEYKLDLFRDIINHDYDDEINHLSRMKKIHSEIYRIHQNMDNFKKHYNNNKKRLFRNQQICKELCSDNRDYENFLNIIK